MIKKVGIILILGILFYGFFVEPSKIRVTKYRIENKALRGVRVVFFSDLHVRPGDYTKLKNVVKLVNEQDPDVVLVGGGYLNGTSASSGMPMAKIAERLSLINMRRNFYSVLGENDTRDGLNNAVNALRALNINVIQNSNRKIVAKGRILYVAGLEDAISGKPDIQKALKNAKAPIIMLSHSPDIFPHIPQGVTLTLAGHTHGGQFNIPPFGRIIKRTNNENYVYGMVQDGGKRMIVTSGVGTGSIPARLNCPPEIVVVDFM